MLAGGDGDGGLLTDLGTDVDLVRHDRLLDPANAEVFDAAGEGEGIGSVPAHPGVEHDVDVGAGRVTERLRELDVAGHALAAIGWSPTGEPLQGAKTLGHLFPGAAVSELRVEAVAEH